MAGSFPVQWIHGSADCATSTDPSIQVHGYDADTFILRQSKCINYEGPFLYLLFGSERVLLLDTGVTPLPHVCPLRATVEGLIEQRLAGRPRSSLPLVVAHSHSHGDHTAGDPQFLGQPHTTVVGATLAEVEAFFGIRNWPDETVGFELGGRRLEVIPIPGHDETDLALYDPRARLLLTGDTFYPGRLYVRDWDAYRASIARLAAFALAHPPTWVLGNHIEMTDEPGIDYPTGTTYQPREHALQLSGAHLAELNEALAVMPTPRREVHNDFIIDPV